MSILGILNIGKSAIFASQAGMNTTSHNIANINTPGFSRQEVVLEASEPVQSGVGYIGQGVQTTRIKRHYDNFINAQIFGQRQNYGRSFALNQALTHVEQVFNDAGEMGLSRPLSEFFNAWNDLSSNPEATAQRIVLLQKANNLVNASKTMERGIISTIRHINNEIKELVDRINSIALDIAKLNEKILEVEAVYGINSANDMRDQREQLLNELSEIIEVSYYEDANGSISITAGMRSLVYGNNTNEMHIETNGVGNIDINLDGINITGIINKGRLGGLIAARDKIESNSLYGLRSLIKSIIDEVNIIHRQGYGLDGSTGNDFFEPVSDIESAIQGFNVKITDIKKIAAASSQGSLPGDNTNALRIADLQNASIGGLGDTFSGYYNGLVLSIGNMSRAASDSLRFEDNLFSELNKRRDSVSGVSLDEEAVNLIRFQRAFEAGAKMIKAADDLLETILNLI